MRHHRGPSSWSTTFFPLDRGSNESPGVGMPLEWLDQHPGGGIEVRDLSKDHQLFALLLRHSGSDWVAVDVAVDRTQ